MRFLVDAQLPAALARWLEAQGHDAAHVYDIGLLEAEDKTIWRAAIERGAILISKDEDFVILQSVSKVSPQLIWVRTGNTTRRELLAMFQKFLPTLLATLAAGEPLIEINGHDSLACSVTLADPLGR